MFRKQDLAVSAPFYHAPMASGAVYIYSGKQVGQTFALSYNCCHIRDARNLRNVQRLHFVL